LILQPDSVKRAGSARFIGRHIRADQYPNAGREYHQINDFVVSAEEI